jgi:branched-chain amino acid aminotransferase
MSALWIDDRLVDPDRATIGVFDHGLTVGDGCFETMKVVRGAAFALTRHLRRLHRSLDALGLVLDRPDDDLRAACAEVIAADPSAGIVRLTVTAGGGPLGSGRGDGPNTVIVASAPDRGWGDAARVVTVPWTRNEHGVLTGVKSTSYAENVVALAHAHERDASEALFANTLGDLCEGTGTNVVVEVDGGLVTPPLSSGCLAGVTRELVLEVADITEADVPYEILTTTSEAFLTSSTREVMSISQVDDRMLVYPPGPRTALVARSFADLVGDDLDP